MVPNVLLGRDGGWIEIPDHAPIEVSTVDDLTAALSQVRNSHQVSGRWVLSPGPGVVYGDIIGAIDAARAAQFPHVQLAGGSA